MALLSTAQLNQIDLVDFLTAFGIHPAHISGDQYAYHSPLRGHPLTTPTLVIDRAANTWHETTTRQKGTFTDFATRFLRCTIAELQERLSVAHSTPEKDDSDIHLVDTGPIRSVILHRLLWNRRIPLAVAQRYCSEAIYRRQEKTLYALAFPCDAGGYELFDPNHHYHIPPTGPTLIVHHAPDITVLGDAFDLMTFVTILTRTTDQLPDLIVLNEPTPLSTLNGLLNRYRHKHLFLPGTPEWNQPILPGITDHRPLYAGYRALNDWFCHPGCPDYPRLDIPPANDPKTP